MAKTELIFITLNLPFLLYSLSWKHYDQPSMYKVETKRNPFSLLPPEPMNHELWNYITCGLWASTSSLPTAIPELYPSSLSSLAWIRAVTQVCSLTAGLFHEIDLHESISLYCPGQEAWQTQMSIFRKVLWKKHARIRKHCLFHFFLCLKHMVLSVCPSCSHCWHRHEYRETFPYCKKNVF